MQAKSDLLDGVRSSRHVKRLLLLFLLFGRLHGGRGVRPGLYGRVVGVDGAGPGQVAGSVRTCTRVVRARTCTRVARGSRG